MPLTKPELTYYKKLVEAHERGSRITINPNTDRPILGKILLLDEHSVTVALDGNYALLIALPHIKGISFLYQQTPEE